MSEEIVIKDKEDVMELVFKLTQFEMTYPKYVQEKAMTVVNQEIVDKIRDKMEQLGYDKKIIQQVRAEFVHIDTDGYIEIDIISDYETDEGFDVAKMMEKGRVRYWTAPIKKKAQHWISAGISWFSRGHWIPARPGDEIFEDVFDSMEDVAQTRLNDETETRLAAILEN